MKSYTADICDNNKNIQVLDPIFKSYGGISMCHGTITTIQFEEDNSDLVKLLRDEKGDGKICVVDVKGDYCAVVGENLMKYAYENNWAGIIVNGYIRDTHETKQIPVGLFALGTYPYKSIKRTTSKRDIPVEFANAIFNVGDTVYADNDGIIIQK